LRFLPGGPSIPDELLVARDEGRVVFFCGAGVSRAKAGLTDFLGLARVVADKLAIGPESATRELIAFLPTLPVIKGLGSLVSADRVFSLIERDFGTTDIYNAIATSLKPLPAADLSAHRCLLDLARGPDGHVRLVTTNFDLLFEECDPRLEKWKPPRLPDPLRNDEFRGVIHLHGHVTEDYTGAAGDGLVISSSEFGRAYLSERWATDFIRTVLEKYVVVFIGYAADDPPMQYLLEGLNRRVDSPNLAYAFHPGSVEDGQARWTQKGVRAISYAESTDHSSLWSSLDAWAVRAQNPDKWYGKVLAFASDGPEPLMSHQRGQVAHVLSTLEGARRLSQADPPLPASWLCTFDPLIRFGRPGRLGTITQREDYFDPFDSYGLDSDPVPAKIDPDDNYAKREVPSGVWHCFALTHQDRQNLHDEELSGFRGHWSVHAPRLINRLNLIGNWFVKVSGQPAAVWWAASQIGIHPDIQEQIKYKNQNSETSPVIRLAWRYLFDTWDKKRDDEFYHDWFDLIASAKHEGWEIGTSRRYAEFQRPYIKAGRAFYGSPRAPSLDAPLTLNDLVHLDVEYPRYSEAISIPDEQIAYLLKELRTNLELGVALEGEIGGYGLHLINTLEIAKPESESFQANGISVPLLAFASFFRRLKDYALNLAQLEARAWEFLPDNPVFTRLLIWASGDKRVVSAKDAGRFFCRLSSDSFWDSGHQADLLTSLANRWDELSKRNREAIEVRLLKGRRQWKKEAKAEFAQHRASLSLTRIMWLKSKGCEFGFDVDKESSKLRSVAPQWTEEYVNNAIRPGGIRGGWVRTDTSSTELQGDVPLSRVLEKAAEISGRTADFLVEKDPYAGLVASKPIRSLAAITLAAKRGQNHVWAWRTFLNSEKRTQDRFRLVRIIGLRLSKLSDAELESLIRPICGWLHKTSKMLLAESRQTFDALWARALKTLESDGESRKSAIVRQPNKPREWATEALNSPVGDLAQAILNDPDLKSPKPGSGLSVWWIKHADDLMGLQEDCHLHAITLFSHNLVWFYQVDPSWTESHLISAIARGGDEASSFWAGYFWGAHLPQQGLYLKLKPAMLRLANDNVLERREHNEKLAGMLLAGWGSRIDEIGDRGITDNEMRSILLNTDDDFRSQIIWYLETWSKDPTNHWADDAIVFLRKVWPRQLAARTSRISSRLCGLAFSQDEKFPQFVDSVLPLVTTIEQDFINLPIFGRSEKGLVERFPEKTLELLSAVLPHDPRKWPYGVSDVLARIATANEALKNDTRLIELTRIWNAR
jgi:SIR2-like domain